MTVTLPQFCSYNCTFVFFYLLCVLVVLERVCVHYVHACTHWFIRHRSFGFSLSPLPRRVTSCESKPHRQRSRCNSARLLRWSLDNYIIIREQTGNAAKMTRQHFYWGGGCGGSGGGGGEGRSLKISVISSNSVCLLGNYTATLPWLWTAGDGTFCKKSIGLISTLSRLSFLCFATSCRQVNFVDIQVNYSGVAIMHVLILNANSVCLLLHHQEEACGTAGHTHTRAGGCDVAGVLLTL